MRRALIAAAAVVLGVAFSAGAQKVDPEAQKIGDAYVAVFNKGDAKGIAALHTADATRLGPDGQLISGRAAIEQSYAAGFAGPLQGSTLTLEHGLSKVIAADVRLMEGRFTVSGAAGVKGRFINTLVRQSGTWLLAAVVTIPDPAPAK